MKAERALAQGLAELQEQEYASRFAKDTRLMGG